ncbi:hypothetical protein J2Y69_000247 [Microbacterium resistens]|uniref:DUF4064 domain-containing protein n=1 Tax=Microbacterium resistens TaxID=156977 RepID=A0ABU1S808_9MICO|nr:hypothetical protein [Microbacterium resistens]MDR6865665.1 hypothetical protein [Microbacterium resistens]
MSDPQQPSVPPSEATAAYPVPPQWAATGQAGPPAPAPTPPGYQAVPAYQAPPGAYAGPAATGYDTPFTPEQDRSSTGGGLGLTALVLSLIATIGSSIAGGWASFEIGRGVIDVDNLRALNGSILRVLSPVRDIVLWAEISFWTGTVLGILAFVVGIIATVRRRGRGAGIAAIVLSVLGPIVFGGVVFTLLTMGAAAGTAQING